MSTTLTWSINIGRLNPLYNICQATMINRETLKHNDVHDAHKQNEYKPTIVKRSPGTMYTKIK